MIKENNLTNKKREIKNNEENLGFSTVREHNRSNKELKITNNKTRGILKKKIHK